MTRTLALGGLLVAGSAVRSRADVMLPNTPAAYRLQNWAAVDPRTAGCGRCEPLPPFNRGIWLNNPRGTGIDDPWRPPKVWPQTKYPVVPAYTRPSFGFYETRWRVLSVCGTPPWTRTPPAPVPPPPIQPATQRPATGAPARNPAEAPPRATPPKATPPRQTPPNEAQPAPNVPGANVPKTGQDESPREFPARSAMAEPDEFSLNPGRDSNSGSAPAITVRPF